MAWWDLQSLKNAAISDGEDAFSCIFCDELIDQQSTHLSHAEWRAPQGQHCTFTIRSSFILVWRSLAFNAWTSWSETRNDYLDFKRNIVFEKKYRWFSNWDKHDSPILDSNPFAFGVFIEFSTFHNRSDMIGRCSPAGLSRRYHLRTWLTPRCVHMLHALSTSSWLDNFRVDTIWAQGYCI